MNSYKTITENCEACVAQLGTTCIIHDANVQKIEDNKV